MGKLTDNDFSRSFISRMQSQQTNALHLDISRKEILKCWQLEVPYLYKDNQRIKKSSRFIRANADGSEDVVELVHPKQALYSHDVKFRKIKTSRQKGEGSLFSSIKK